MQGPPGEVAAPPSAISGQPIEVEYGGQGPLYSSPDGVQWEEVPLDPESRKGQVSAPPGSTFLLLSNRNLANPQGGGIEILDPPPSPVK